MSITTGFQVSGMTCGHCETAVRQEVSKIEGVEHVDVSAVTGLLSVTSSVPVAESDVLAAVDEAGYEAAPAS